MCDCNKIKLLIFGASYVFAEYNMQHLLYILSYILCVDNIRQTGSLRCVTHKRTMEHKNSNHKDLRYVLCADTLGILCMTHLR
jgi:hypothetical protein